MAIFYSILEEPVAPSANIYSQVYLFICKLITRGMQTGLPRDMYMFHSSNSQGMFHSIKRVGVFRMGYMRASMGSLAGEREKTF